MAKEVDLKKVELKVSVNCCDGCKKKVKKVLQGIEGVLKTEIDPLQSKVTVLGNVDSKVLIKKLLKVGKQAEMWNSGNQNAGKAKKEAEVAVTKTECQKDKCLDSHATITDKTKESIDSGDGNKNKTLKNDQTETESAAKISSIEVNKNEIPPNPQPYTNSTDHPILMNDGGNVKTQTQCFYMVGPSAVTTMPFYVIPSYMAPPFPPTNNGQEFYNSYSISQPPFQTPATEVGDYFSDDNTVGCSVM
ncbi:hypothetical protein RGQ29_011852 [Quercus rubra]|uniref:HMA domain-containing protein n=1 Tax=Quercus rubra TaxID=3512 RepID=A0AAN7G5L0_QUERU|nr:hypothetical protein RGQ29_011852 [Quercus rubra]